MSFITPLLFVFYLQVMPPPPPTINGGASLWSGYTNNGDGTVTEWNRRNLNKAIRSEDGADYIDDDDITTIIGTAIGYNGLSNILTAIEAGLLYGLTEDEWRTLINRSRGDDDLGFGNRTFFEKACRLARTRGGAAGEAAANRTKSYTCPDEVPIPSELISLSVLSFLIIYYLYSREDYSNFGQIKHSE
jgi:hypothetical protein